MGGTGTDMYDGVHEYRRIYVRVVERAVGRRTARPQTAVVRGTELTEGKQTADGGHTWTSTPCTA